MKIKIDPLNKEHQNLYNNSTWKQLFSQFSGDMYTISNAMGYDKPYAFRGGKRNTVYERREVQESFPQLKQDAWNRKPMEFSDMKPAHPDIFNKTFV